MLFNWLADRPAKVRRCFEIARVFAMMVVIETDLLIENAVLVVAYSIVSIPDLYCALVRAIVVRNK